MSMSLYINWLHNILSNHFMKTPDLDAKIPMLAITTTPY